MAVRKTIKRKLKGKWMPFERSLRTIEVLFIVLASGGLIYGGLQLKVAFQNLRYTSEQINQIEQAESASMMFKYEDEFNNPKNNGIFEAIDNNQPILTMNNGIYSTTDLDNYLGIFNSLNDVYESNLITTTMLYDDFDDYIMKSWNNKEIQAYLKTVRQKDSEYFGGFDQLVNALRKYN